LKTIVVTGAAGFIGSHVCERLVAEGARVVGIDSFSDAYPLVRKQRNLAPLAGERRFALVEADLAADSLAPVLRRASAVVHLAGRAGVRGRDPEPYRRENVLATRALLSACHDAGVPRVVFGSSSSVYGRADRRVTERARQRPLSPYAVSKAECERLCARSGLPVVTLRFFTVYGPRQRPDMAFARFIEAALAHEAAPVFGDGAQVRDFTYVADAVEAVVLALRDGQPGRAYNVAGGRPVALSTALADLAALLGRPVPLEPRPASALEPSRTHADLKRARRELGYAPRVALVDGLRAQVDAALQRSREIVTQVARR
jgi:nucleoside-diphosphate-sugar epimerase